MSLFKDYNEYKDRSVPITGGLGFIGSSLARKLVQMGNVKVILLDAFVSGQGGSLFNIEDIKGQVELHTSTMCDSSIVNHLVGGMDFIFNLAGSVSHLDSMLYPQYDLENNCAAPFSASGSVS